MFDLISKPPVMHFFNHLLI